MIALCQPAIMLIDHGHFQYNSVALGLSIASFSFMVQSDFASCIWGGFFFTLALNFKQMTLYYAPVVFFYLLWEPFVKYSPSDQLTLPPIQRLEHVIRRIF